MIKQDWHMKCGSELGTILVLVTVHIRNIVTAVVDLYHCFFATPNDGDKDSDVQIEETPLSCSHSQVSLIHIFKKSLI